MKGKILITGATGNVGSELINQLSENGEDIIAGVRNLERAKKKIRQDIEFKVFDYDRPESYDDIFIGVDRIFAMTPPLDYSGFQRMRPFLDAAKSNGVSRIVNMSAIGVKPGGENPLGLTEKFLTEGGFDYTFLRPNWFSQNFINSLLPEIINYNIISLPAGKGKISFVDVRDIAAAALAALTENGHSREAYTLTGPAAYDFYEAADIIRKVSGRKVKYHDVGEEEYISKMQSLGMPGPSIKLSLFLYDEVKRGGAEEINDSVKELIGRKPLSLMDFAEEYAYIWR